MLNAGNSGGVSAIMDQAIAVNSAPEITSTLPRPATLHEFPQRNSYGHKNYSLMRRQLALGGKGRAIDASQAPRLANGAESFLYMRKHVDDITNANHPAKRYRNNAKQLSMAYYMANSTER